MGLVRVVGVSKRHYSLVSNMREGLNTYRVPLSYRHEFCRKYVLALPKPTGGNG